MKKIIALLLAAIMTVSMVGCKEDDPLPTSPNATGPARKEGVYAQDSYTVTDQQAAGSRGNVVATMGNAQLTSGVFHAYYWMAVYTFMETYGSNALYYGLRYDQPLDEQPFNETGNWQHYFIEQAIAVWHSHQAMALMAEKEGLALSPERQALLDGLRDTMEASAEEDGYASVDEMIHDQMGAGCTYEDYYTYTQTIYLSYTYNDYVFEKLDIDQAAVDAYFAENEEALKKQGITKDAGDAYNVRHILVPIEGGAISGDKVEYTDADWEVCRAKAQKLLDDWLSGGGTEDGLAELAKEHSSDANSKNDGGLYEGLSKENSLPKSFRDWYTDGARQVGDYGLVKSDYGYHIMYLSSREPAWIYNCRNILVSNGIAEYVNAAVAACPILIHYENIALGEVTLVADK